MIDRAASPVPGKSNEPVVLLEGASKSYRLYRSPKERLLEALHPARRKLHEEFWAVRDVTLHVARGESLGLVGQNGAGKSTLLQLIAGVLTPTNGTVRVTGRVAALLELGAGFNPDLTGRENVSLFSVIVGVDRAAIPDRIAAVEAFADIGDFFDQPMRIYSSGMYARVAFANAIQVDPDLLIIDEILGVGDAKFQEKCYAKIEELRQGGTSVLFVSHSTDAIQRNCSRAALLHQGRVVTTGAADETISAYHDLLYGSRQVNAPVRPHAQPAKGRASDVEAAPHEGLPDTVRELLDREHPCHADSPFYNRYERRFGSREAEIVDFCITVDGETRFGNLRGTETLNVYLKVHFHRDVPAPQIGWGLVTPQGLVLAGSNTSMQRKVLTPAPAGSSRLYGIELRPALCQGEYFLNIGVGEWIDGAWDFLDNRRSAIHLTVGSTPRGGGFFDLPARCTEFSMEKHEQ